MNNININNNNKFNKLCIYIFNRKKSFYSH